MVKLLSFQERVDSLGELSIHYFFCKKMANKGSPRDAQVMTAILKDMGVTDYEPRLINQMLEFTYRE